MMFDGETLQVTLCGTNLPQNAASSCHHPFRTDDGATAYVLVHMYWYIRTGTYVLVHMYWYICTGTYLNTALPP
jgi:hypothetical protein